MEALPLLLQDVSLNIRRYMWTPEDGVLVHLAIEVRNFINNTYSQWISREAPVSWPPRSTDHNPLYSYLWERIKKFVYG